MPINTLYIITVAYFMLFYVAWDESKRTGAKKEIAVGFFVIKLEKLISIFVYSVFFVGMRVSSLISCQSVASQRALLLSRCSHWCRVKLHVACVIACNDFVVDVDICHLLLWFVFI